ncbi:MAG: PLP-dependent aminotransferase family protein [Alphaproteobacteria bacterium]|nr:PLP-dependent aminotransferase family protein [Alphaproteobacteria bacterium]MBU2125537.1 PLP-dependent aminotransferase family protein [Alphaproteobacteria bacterium]MBU2208504.1 PLP-dependent aminotransferase family protein [Alphaproteobacteria bacterium]MBU2289931.1 PLP-dependent aminotransferase family protein [Alphaproteobacteria bacterium]MBU2398590.1 PLP-dependent aminotransferase family protein [Alphaproteobacteria bacterium]
MIRLDPAGEGTLQARLYRTLRFYIARGILAAGARLPASRVLSEDLGISRNTVTATLEQLAADGWVEARRGSGVYVSRVVVPGEHKATHHAVLRDGPDMLPFDVGPPGLDFFPLDAWRRIQARRWGAMSRSAMREGASAGYSELRRTIAEHMWIARGLPCTPDQVFITQSIRTGLDLVLRALAKPGDDVWIEDPGYFGSKALIEAAHLRPIPVPVDEQGLDVAAGRLASPGARMALVTPQCQFPTCVSLSTSRRTALLEWAKQANAWIFEDDYDAEYRFDQEASLPLAAEPGGERVIYAHSFNKSLFPALRMGFLIVPTALVETLALLRSRIDGYPSVPNQMVLCDFIEEGWLDTHLRSCRVAYRERRAVMFDEVAPRLAPWLHFEPNAAGLHVVARLEPSLDPQELVLRAREKGIELTPMAMLSEQPHRERGILLGFAGYTPSQLVRAADKLAALISQLAGSRTPY